MSTAHSAAAQVPHYTIAVCKGSALVEETKALLRVWEPRESLSEFQERVLRDDILGRAVWAQKHDLISHRSSSAVAVQILLQAPCYSFLLPVSETAA